MNYVHTAEFSVTDERRAGRFASVVAKTIFVSLMVLIAFTAIPYGTVEPWWKAFFVLRARFANNASTDREHCYWLLDDSGRFAAFTANQPHRFRFHSNPFDKLASNASGIPHPQWNAISADPYGSRFFALQLLSLTLAAALLFRHVSNEKRLRVLINVIIGVAVAGTLFGIIGDRANIAPGSCCR